MTARIAARIGSGVCALALCAAVWAAFAPMAHAVSGVQTGYWSALPAAPQVPAGGFEVASNASGPQAVAALRFSLADGESAPVVTLKVAQAQPQAQIVIEACAIAAGSSGWAPPPGGGPGALADAPKPDCSNGLVAGAVAADGSTVTFDFSGMAGGSPQVDVVFQPGLVASPAAGTAPGAPDSIYPTFDAAFQPVDAGQIAVQIAAGSESGAPPVGATSGGAAYAAPPPATGQQLTVPLPAAADNSGAAPVVASPQPSPGRIAAAPAALVTTKRNLRLLFGIGMLASDLMFVLLWLDRRSPGPQDRPLTSIYHPPPAAP
jgi:hypothetical protein